MEEWKPVVGYEGLYEISNTGRVKSTERATTVYDERCSSLFQRFVAERMLKPVLKGIGYYQVSLCKESSDKPRTINHHIHRLVAEAFIDNPENKREVNHINGVKTDNNLNNLEWATTSENRKHAYATGLKSNRKGPDASDSKLTHQQVGDVYYSLKMKLADQNQLAVKYNVCQQSISNLWRKKRHGEFTDALDEFFYNEDAPFKLN